MIFAFLFTAFAALPAPSDPAAHAAERDKSCTAEHFDIVQFPDGRRNYREKRSGVTLPAVVGKAMLAGCGVAPNGFEAYYEADPASPTHERCPHIFQIRYFPGQGAHVREAVDALARKWGAEANPAFGNRRVGSGDRTIEVYHAAAVLNGQRGRYRLTQFGYAKGADLVLGAESLAEEPFCTQSLQTGQAFLREFPWP